MATSIIMPKAGMAMETGTVIEWKVSIGDKIDVGDEILEIETDKVAMPVEAETSGYLLAILAEPGDVIPVTETIGWIGEQGEAVPDAPAGAESSAGDAPAPAAAPSGGTAAAESSNEEPSGAEPAAAVSGGASAERVGDRVKATPAARRRAAELGVNLATVAPTGPDGDVRARDVDAASDGGTGAPAVSPLAREEARRAGVSLDGIQGTGPGGRIQRRDVVEQAGRPAAPAGGVEPSSTRGGQLAGDTRTPLVGMRKVIAERMLESHRTMPPVTLNAEVSVDALLDLRGQLNAGAESAGRRKVSINDILLLAAAKAVRACPWVNVSLDGTDVVQHEVVNVGMAVALEQGLVVPVIHEADRLSLSAVSDRARELGRRARERKLEVTDLEGGTFTVSNLGMYGITSFTPIINPPQAAILGVGTIRQVLAMDDAGAVSRRSLIDLSLTVDHRLIDGAQGALFVKYLVDLLENPARILL